MTDKPAGEGWRRYAAPVDGYPMHPLILIACEGGRRGCEGCLHGALINVSAHSKTGDDDNPTLSPSLHFNLGYEDGGGRQCGCHFFVRNGAIEPCDPATASRNLRLGYFRLTPDIKLECYPGDVKCEKTLQGEKNETNEND